MPIFIVGCGRSGTTILGRLLAAHPEITYLNEPRALWAKAYPETDIWSPDAITKGGQLGMDESDCTPRGNRRLTAGFYCRTVATGRRRLVEKTPVNSFRLPFIDSIFPDARIIHVIRHGLEVADSIEKRAAESQWYGHDDYKWKLLLEHAGHAKRYQFLGEFCTTHRLRGLLEWRMAVETVIEYLARRPAEYQLTVRYEELVEAPVETSRGIEKFAGLGESTALHRFAEKNLRRRSLPVSRAPLSGPEEQLAGDLLKSLGYVEA